MPDIYSFFDWANKTSQYVAEKLPECDELFFHCGWFWKGTMWMSPTACSCRLEFSAHDSLFLRDVVLPELKRLLFLGTDETRVELRVADGDVNVCLLWPEVPLKDICRMSQGCFSPGGWVVTPGEHPFLYTL
jgi:hypothetical protein